NRPHGERPDVPDPARKLPSRDLSAEPPAGSKQKLTELGPEGLARWLRENPSVGVAGATVRDAHQWLLAARVRSKDLLAVAPCVARVPPELRGMGWWGGATFDVALRVLAVDPWGRLERLRAAVPNICLQ